MADASSGWVSSTGTCLCAAAWKTTSGWYRSNASNTAAPVHDVDESELVGTPENPGGVVKMGLVVVEQDHRLGAEGRDL